MTVLRRICGITRRDRRRNVDILKELQTEKDINEVLQTRRLTYFGHVTRMKKDRYPNILMHGYTHGRRPSGRPRKRWLGNITEDCEELTDFMNLTIRQGITANDGVKWINILSATRAAGARGHRLRRRGFKSSKSRNLDHSNWCHSKAWVLFPIRLPYSNYGSTLHYFRDKARYWSKIVIFFIPLCIRRPR